jgi:hypothetical protein
MTERLTDADARRAIAEGSVLALWDPAPSCERN